MSETLLAIVISIALNFQPAWQERDEPPETRKARIEQMARAVLGATRNPHEIAVLLELGRAETWFSAYSHRACTPYDKRYSGDCDRIWKGKRKGQIRARSFWQLWERTCPALWKEKPGSDAAVNAAAKCALKHFRFARKQCARRTRHGALAGAFSGYRSTMVCEWEPAKARAWRARQLEGKLRFRIASSRKAARKKARAESNKTE